MFNFVMELGPVHETTRHNWDRSSEIGFPDGLEQRSVVLIGVMGTGKTSVGRRLARDYGLPFMDSDKEIERAANMRVATFFKTYGEAAFRENETRIIQCLIGSGQAVLSLGGGAFETKETRDLLLAEALVVWINAPCDVLFRRLQHSRTERPLLKVDDPLQKLHSLMEAREHNYRQAQVHVPLGNAGPRRAQRLVRQAVRDYLSSEGSEGNAIEHVW